VKRSASPKHPDGTLSNSKTMMRLGKAAFPSTYHREHRTISAEHSKGRGRGGHQRDGIGLFAIR
jgi:hypothetical protein